MRRLTRFHLVLAAVPLAILGPACGAGGLPPQTSTQAGVTVKATPRTVSGNTWEFEIVLDTHIQELNDDLRRTAVLVGEGSASITPTGVEGDPPGGHHRRLVLRFNAMTPPPANLELRIQRVGEPSPRIFRWQLSR